MKALEETALTIASEYTGLNKNTLKLLRSFNDKLKRVVSVIIMAIDIILDLEELSNDT